MAVSEDCPCPSCPKWPAPASNFPLAWPQDQLKQLQDILGNLSEKEESRRASQHHQDQKVNSEAQRSSSLVAQLRAMVADREAKVRQLELEIGQLSVQVSRVPVRPACQCPHSSFCFFTLSSALATLNRPVSVWTLCFPLILSSSEHTFPS